MIPPIEAEKHSYEQFAATDEVKAVDRALIQKSPRVHSATDLGTGTGAIIEMLLEQGKLEAPFHVYGVDVDASGLARAQEKFARFDTITFINGSAEHVPQIPPASQELVTICSAIHLTNAEQTMKEAARILAPGGMLLMSTAYEKDHANPDGAARMLGIWAALAKRKLQANGLSASASPSDFYRYSEADFITMAEDAGLTDIQTEWFRIKMDAEVLKGIGNYWEFANGTFPGVPIEEAAAALVSTVDPMLERFKTDHIPRNFLFLSAKKPEK